MLQKFVLENVKSLMQRIPRIEFKYFFTIIFVSRNRSLRWNSKK